MNRRLSAALSSLLLGIAAAGCSSNASLPPRGSEVTEADSASFRQKESEKLVQQQISPPLDAPLQLIEFAEPRYPSFLLGENARSLTGTVVIAFELLPSGHVGATQVLSKTDEALNKPAVRALRNWRFSPPMRDGKPVRLHLQHSFRMEP